MGLALYVAGALALAAGAPFSGGWPSVLHLALRAGAFGLLALFAAGLGEGPFVPSLAAAEGCSELLSALEGFEIFALLSALLAEAGWIVLFLREGGGAGLLKAEPVRLAGVLCAVSAAVFVLRRLVLGKGPASGPFALSTLAAGAGAALGATLPLARWPAMLGAALLLGWRAASLDEAPLGRGPHRWRGALWLRWLGVLAVLIAFRASKS